MENPYRLPWDIEYERHWNYDSEKKWVPCGEFVKPLVVLRIFNCDGETVIQTDSGCYNPDIEQAEFIIRCVNSSGEG